jgi:hypothetical protein
LLSTFDKKIPVNVNTEEEEVNQSTKSKPGRKPKAE